MRIITAVAAFGLLAAIGAAPASAATATFSGTCAITGKSTFDPPLTGSQGPVTYDFKSGPPADGAEDGTKCSGMLNGKSVTDAPAVAAVKGDGNLSCDMGESTSPGKGSLTFADGSVFLFDFTFTSILTEVDFVAKYGDTETTGHASFLSYAGPTTPIDCSPAGGGVKELGFEATTEEGSKPIQGTKPDSGGGGSPEGGNEGAGPPQGGGTDDAAAKKKRKACVKKAKKKKNKKKRKEALKRCKKIK